MKVREKKNYRNTRKKEKIARKRKSKKGAILER